MSATSVILPSSYLLLQLEEIFSHHLCESKYINWSSVVISAILPLPLPSQAQVNLVYKYLIIASKENV